MKTVDVVKAVVGAEDVSADTGELVADVIIGTTRHFSGGCQHSCSVDLQNI